MIRAGARVQVMICNRRAVISSTSVWSVVSSSSQRTGKGSNPRLPVSTAFSCSRMIQQEGTCPAAR